MSHITTHILDLARGRPAAHVPVKLFSVTDDGEKQVGEAKTDSDGRIADGLIGDGDYSPGTYRIEFDTDSYFQSIDGQTFHPIVSISFRVSPNEDHYHVPLLLSPFGYSTYRGS